MTNQVLEAIRDRRSSVRFEETPIGEEKIQAILEAGRWAPSWINSQPWRFILVTDQDIKQRISEHVPTAFNLAITDAPINIVVSVDTEEDPHHFVEDGAVATQNMALAAHSLGLGSCWMGVFDLKGGKDSGEEKIKEILEIPKTHRVISVLPVGVSKAARMTKRKELSQLVYHEKFQKA